MKKFETNKQQKGFTLIELSIVLVIIGLIVGGVLVGQDLIKAAELRAAIGQIEKYDAAVNTFRGKYNGLPGDMPSPATYGFLATASTATGNGVLNESAGTLFDNEPAAFFKHMSQANLIQENIVAATGADFDTANVDTIGNYVPPSRLGKGILVLAMSTNNLNYYMLDNPTVSNAALTMGHGLPPIDAFAIDNKMDDGNPVNGKATAVDAIDASATTTANAGPMLGKCVDSTAGTYQLSSAAISNAAACTIRIRGSF